MNDLESRSMIVWEAFRQIIRRGGAKDQDSNQIVD